jgi:aldose 1-epimerase
MVGLMAGTGYVLRDCVPQIMSNVRQRNFTVVSHTTDSITFSIVDPDGKEGFPGEVISYITYSMKPYTWNFKMVALSTTKKTPIMLSSHVR